MKLNHFNYPDARRRDAFTMIEVAISIGVVAFALVAIIGILPTGLQVQKDNREETIINQDGPLLVEAIRSGTTNLSFLSGNIEWIQFYTNEVAFGTRWTNNGANNFYARLPFHNGARDIVGHLSAPSIDNSFPAGVLFSTKARFLANSGPLALEANGARDLTFSYLVTSEITPYSTIDTNAFTQVLSENLYELKMTFQWPVIGRGANEFVGANKKVIRTLVSGQLELDTDGSNYFFKPLQYGLNR